MVIHFEAVHTDAGDFEDASSHYFCPSPPLSCSPAASQLDQWAKVAGLKYFGTTVGNPGLGNQAYMPIARDTAEFGSVTPANGQKWSYTEPSQGKFT